MMLKGTVNKETAYIINGSYNIRLKKCSHSVLNYRFLTYNPINYHTLFNNYTYATCSICHEIAYIEFNHVTKVKVYYLCL